MIFLRMTLGVLATIATGGVLTSCASAQRYDGAIVNGRELQGAELKTAQVNMEQLAAKCASTKPTGETENTPTAATANDNLAQLDVRLTTRPSPIEDHVIKLCLLLDGTPLLTAEAARDGAR